MLRLESDKSDSMIVRNEFSAHAQKLDLARGRNSWCWPKEALPLRTRMVVEDNAAHEDVKEDDNEIELYMLTIAMKV